VRDAGGATVLSAPVPINVVAAPTLVVDSGIDGATIDDDNILLAGTVRAPANSAVTVNGQGAALGRDGRFFVNGLRLLPGSNTVTLILNSQDAAPIARTITVNGSAAKPFQVTVEPSSGLAPLDATLRIVNRGNVAFKRITVDANGDGTTELALEALADGEATIAVPYPQPGVYTLVVKVYDDSDAVIYQARRMVKAVAPAELGMRVVDVYRTLVDRLAANDATGALQLFVGEARARYAEVFTALAGALPTVAAQLGRLVDGAISEDWAELTILRDTPEGPRVFMINLLRGGDGIWRMESM
jgi:hypothetical protein